MTSISAALHSVRAAFEDLVAETRHLRSQLESIVQRGAMPAGATVRGGRAPAGMNGTPAKRGRKFKFTDAQAAGFRRRVESGDKATTLARELKISLPTMYNTLRRAGWNGRRGRRARVASAKRGRPFRFTEQQAAGFRKRVESGEKVTSIAKEVKVSLPALYSTLRRAGWTGRKGRKAKAA